MSIRVVTVRAQLMRSNRSGGCHPGADPPPSNHGGGPGGDFTSSHFTTAVWTPFLSKFQASRDIQRRHSSVAQKLPYNIQPQLKECRPETTMRVFITARTASSHHECLELTYKPNINLCLPNAFVTVGYSALHRFPVRKTRRNGFSHWPEDRTGPAPGAWGQHQGGRGSAPKDTQPTLGPPPPQCPGSSIWTIERKTQGVEAAEW